MDQAPPRPWRRTRLAAATLALIYVTLETGAYVTSAIRAGDARPFSAWQALRAELAEKSIADPEAAPNSSEADGERTEVLHPFIGYLSELNTGTGGPDQIALDSTEFYDPASPLYHPSPERRVIAITGGSVAVQFATGPGAEALRQGLSEDPAYRDKQLLLVNMATNGFKQPQQLMAVAYALSLGVHLDLVLNIDGFNEVALHVAENGKKGVNPSYPRGWYFRAGRSPDSDILPLMGILASADRDRIGLARNALTSPWRWSPTFQLIWYSRDQALWRRIVAHKRILREARPQRRDPRRTGPSIEFASDEDLYQHMAERWADGSRQLDRLCSANGIGYYHFLQPNQYVAGSKVLSADELEGAYNEQQPYRPGVLAGYPLLRQLGSRLRQEGIEFTDFTPLFQSVVETLYVDDCCHMNGLANELMAQAMASEILE